MKQNFAYTPVDFAIEHIPELVPDDDFEFEFDFNIDIDEEAIGNAVFDALKNLW